MQRAYTSTVFGPIHLATGFACAAGFAVFTAVVGTPVWVTAVGAAAMLITAAYLSLVRLSIGTDRILVGHGLSGHARVIPAEAVASATEEHLRWAQVFGIGVSFHRATQRLTVRPGPTLHLQLTTGEHLRISTPHPATARSVMSSLPSPSSLASLPASAGEEERMDNNKSPRPWFGPKRVGYGLRPQTWQGWTIVFAVAVAVIVIMLLVRH
jgi:hypothetical protein